jgi:mRNA interferase HigB
VRVISNKRLVDLAALHPKATTPLKGWRKNLESNRFAHFADLKAAFGSVDRVGHLYVFDIGGNKFRVVAAVHFDRQFIYIRNVFTHAEYDRWNPS